MAKRKKKRKSSKRRGNPAGLIKAIRANPRMSQASKAKAIAKLSGKITKSTPSRRRRKSRSATKSIKTAVSRVRSMARRRYYRRGGSRGPKGLTIPLALVGGVGAGLSSTAGAWRAGGPEAGLRELGRAFTGYDATSGSFSWTSLSRGLFPVLVGAGVHMIAGRAGLNRYMRNVPFIRI